jgi:transcription initiation factor IIE alpha subunit
LIFQGKTGDEIADEILQALQASDEEGMSRNDLINYFNRNVKAARIRAALMQLHRDGWATYEKVKSDGPGAPEERWYASVPE